MTRSDFNYTYNARGYIILYKGKPIGGAGILPSARGPRGRAVQKQLDDYQRQAEARIRNLLTGNTGRLMGEAIRKIDTQNT